VRTTNLVYQNSSPSKSWEPVIINTILNKQYVPTYTFLRLPKSLYLQRKRRNEITKSLLSIFFVLAIKVGKVAKVHFFGDM
jgi:hypothetical protein